MPKKDTSAAVLGMLSSAGAQTRPAPVESPVAVAPAPEPVITTPTPAAAAPVAASVRTLPPPAKPMPVVDEAPRTLRLRPDTAARLRAAWLEAKRDDVLLTAQDFASNLVEDALLRRQRRTTSTQ
jgi:pimeloyl-ACP methyl ester carboxylesterase